MSAGDAAETAKLDRQRYFRELEQKAAQASVDLRAGKRDEFGNPTSKTKRPVVAKPKRKPRPRVVVPMPTNCPGCGRKLRPKGAPKSEHPGTVAVSSYGKCDSCRRGVSPETRRRRGDPGETNLEPNCLTCGRAMRPYHGKAADHPGTAARQNPTTCASCAAGNKPRQPRKVVPCQTCERPMRPSGTLLRDWPGTTSRRNSTICQACAAGRVPRKAPTADECQACHRQMRPTGARLVDWPGTVTRKNRTTCEGCAKGCTPKVARPDRCVGCGYTLRPRHAKYRPGTVEHFKAGRCRTCHRKSETVTARMAS